jgi:hypothetical protein
MRMLRGTEPALPGDAGVLSRFDARPLSSLRMKDWEIFADKLSKARLELGLYGGDRLTHIATTESVSLCAR